MTPFLISGQVRYSVLRTKMPDAADATGTVAVTTGDWRDAAGPSAAVLGS